MDAALEKKLIQCLDALEEGRSLEQALALFPEDVDRLRPLLAAAGQLSEMRVGHRLESQVKSRQQFLAHAEKLRSGAVRPIPTRTWRRLSFSLALVTLLLVISTSGLFASARRALPGDILFGTKLALEDARMALTNDPSARESLRNQFQQERMEEIRQLLASGRRADVTFTGFIESMAGETWSIAGLPVQVNDQTVIDGEPAVGKLAEVIGRTESGVVVAAEIVVRTDPNAPLPTPSPSPQPPPTVTDTPAPSPSPTVTETPSATNTPSATPTPTATPTGTPSPSPTVTPFPTATPTSDHGNTNDDDNTNDNDGTNDNDDTNDDDDTNDNDNDNDNINNYE